MKRLGRQTKVCGQGLWKTSWPGHFWDLAKNPLVWIWSCLDKAWRSGWLCWWVHLVGMVLVCYCLVNKFSRCLNAFWCLIDKICKFQDVEEMALWQGKRWCIHSILVYFCVQFDFPFFLRIVVLACRGCSTHAGGDFQTTFHYPTADRRNNLNPGRALREPAKLGGPARPTSTLTTRHIHVSAPPAAEPVETVRSVFDLQGPRNEARNITPPSPLLPGFAAEASVDLTKLGETSQALEVDRWTGSDERVSSSAPTVLTHPGQSVICRQGCRCRDDTEGFGVTKARISVP